MSTITIEHTDAAGAGSLPRSGGRRTMRHTLVLTRRHLLHLFRMRGQALWSIAQPVMFLLLFNFMFGGVIGGKAGNYISFVMPGIVVYFLALTVFSTAIGLHTDISQGIVDRFRSLPIARSAVLSGRIFSDVLRCAFNIVLLVVVGVLLGFRFSTGVIPIVGAFLLAIAFGLALAWIGAWIGLTVRSVETVSTVGTIWLVPLTFLSSLFVPTNTLPGWLQAFVKINPLSNIADALRGLTLGGPIAAPVLASLAWTIGILVIFSALAVRQYRRIE